MKMGKVFVAVMLLGLFFMGNAFADVIWVDNFESYTAGQFPSSNWLYSGNSNITVDNTKSAEGIQSLRASGYPGRCWEALPDRLMQVSTQDSFFY